MMDDGKARGRAAIRRARDACYRLLDDPAECVALFAQVGLPLVAPDLRAEAMAAFRASAANPQFRFEWALCAYRGALKLWARGALD